MITRVKQLTGMNIRALERYGVGKPGKTIADFEGTPSEALAALYAAVSAKGPDRSIAAVTRKLRDAAKAYRRPAEGVHVMPVTEVTRYVVCWGEVASDER